jgi:iron complex transport system ATP-binding protein
MNTNEPYLTTKDLSIGYSARDHRQVLFEHLNLSLFGGEMICFMGPNGVGKSSLLRTLSGLQKPLTGQVQVHVSTEVDDHSRKIAVVLTDRIHALNLTVEEIVAFGRYPYLGWNIDLTAADREIIRTSIEQVHLHQLLKKKLFQLSDGQLQMVMIARALAQDTPIIMLDEPTAHLDLNNRVEIMDLLRQLARTTGKSILLATHELDLALQTADLIWLTGKNQNILTGLPEDLVLNGSFDEIFAFKGFDLKTGRVSHDPFRKRKVYLTGDGPEFLWTKNALERNGFEISQGGEEITIKILPYPGGIRWIIRKNNVESEVTSIESLLKLL